MIHMHPPRITYPPKSLADDPAQAGLRRQLAVARRMAVFLHDLERAQADPEALLPGEGPLPSADTIEQLDTALFILPSDPEDAEFHLGQAIEAMQESIVAIIVDADEEPTERRAS